MNTDRVRIDVNEDIYLSEVRTQDRSSFVEYLNVRGISDHMLRIPWPYSEADADHFLNLAQLETEEQGQPLKFSIRNSEGKAIGGFGFEGLVSGHQAEIGYWIARPFQGQGVMTQVVAAGCDYAFREWGLVRITANIFPANQPSVRVVEKNGFIYEGTLRKRYRKGDEFFDSRLYALVQD